MKKATSIILLLTLLSCATVQTVQSNPKAEYIAAANTFAATVDQLAAMRESGMFTVEEADRITEVIKQGRLYLEEWKASVESGGGMPASAVSFAALQKALADYIAKAGE